MDKMNIDGWSTVLLMIYYAHSTGTKTRPILRANKEEITFNLTGSQVPEDSENGKNSIGFGAFP